MGNFDFSNKFLLYKKLYCKVFSYIHPNSQLVLAFSGGLDSTVLLSLLTKLPNEYKKLFDIEIVFDLRAVYIDHGINDQSDRWAMHCKQQCEDRNIPFSVISVICNKNSRHGIESSAREARYKALFNDLVCSEVLLTAHHLNDQVETLLLALKRGSGPAGLSSMSEFTYNNKLLRPLLSITKLELKSYARDFNLVWIEDLSNFNINLDRNFLRIKILPILTKRWPYFIHTAARSAYICLEQEILLNELLKNILVDIIHDDGSLLYNKLLLMSDHMRYSLLRRWLATCNIKLMPSYKKLYFLWNEVVLSRKDANPILQINNFLIRRFNDKLYVLPKYMQYNLKDIKIMWYVTEQPLLLPYCLGLLLFFDVNNIVFLRNKLDLVEDKSVYLSTIFYNIVGKISIKMSYCLVRVPYVNEKIFIKFGHIPGILHIVGRNRGRSLKKIWQEFKVPPWLRTRIPLLFYNDQLIAAIGIFITNEGMVKNNSKCKIFWLQ